MNRAPTTIQRPLRVGFLGVGEIAQQHAAVVQALGHQVYAGACRTGSSQRWARFSHIFPEARLIADGVSLLNDSAIDAVVACLPWDETPRWLDVLLSAEKPVLLEKPIALSGSSLARSMEVAGQKIGNKYVGLNRRFYEPVAAMRQRLSQGGLKSVAVEIPEDVKGFIDTYGPQIVGNTMAFYSCHVLDLVQHLLGALRPVRVYSYRSDYGRAGSYYSYTCLLETADALPVTLAINDNHSANMAIHFRFNDGTHWVLSPIEVLAVYDGFNIESVQGTQIKRFRPKEIRRVEADASYKPGFYSQMRAFLDGGIAPVASIEENMTLLRLVESIRESSIGRT